MIDNDGDITIDGAQEDIILTPEGIAVFPVWGIAAAADLHIGFEESLGESLARVQTRLLSTKFNDVLSRYKLKDVVLNGDIKYSFGAKSAQEWDEINLFLSGLLKSAKVRIVKGNHDNYLEEIVENLGILVCEELELGDVLFTHGDKMQEKNRSKHSLTVIGNEHPAITLRDDVGATKRYPCFIYARKENLLVLPAVNPWAPGTDILSTASDGFLSPLLRAADLDAAEVYPFDGENIYHFKNIGDVKKLLIDIGRRKR